MCCKLQKPVPVAAPAEALVYGSSIAGVVGSNPADGMNVFLF